MNDESDGHTDFEWDESKALTNKAKHGLPFGEAIRCFFNPGIDIPDTRKDYGETRTNRYGGLYDGTSVVICFTRRADRIRLILARPANRDERELIP